MEDHLADVVIVDFLVKIGWYLAVALFTLVVSVGSTLLWGRGGRKRLVKRIATLEKENRAPSITQTINFHGADSANERERHLRSAIDAETVQSLKKTIRRLDQHPLGNGHTYARLPDGTNVVSMADGRYRLAVPINLSVAFRGEMKGSLSPSLEKVPRADSDCVGRIVRDIPCGKVVTYGDISKAVYGHPKASKAVGQCIAREAAKDRNGFPWWRVCFNGLKPKNDEARKYLEQEGVKFSTNGAACSQHSHELPQGGGQ